MKLQKYLMLIGSVGFLAGVVLLMKRQKSANFSTEEFKPSPITSQKSPGTLPLPTALPLTTKEWAGSIVTEKRITNAFETEILWHIDDPNVKAASTEYAFIEFKKGDVVTMRAGGCVQTGGAGETWKRYLDPINSDWSPCDKYYGQLHFPGTTTGLTSLIRLCSSNLTILKDCSLQIGYVDDNYSDNGYWNHDDGNCDQCKDIGDAWIELTVSRPAESQKH